MTDAFDLVVAMLRRSFGDEPSFPPTELFSEGWMLRLLLESAYEGRGGVPFEFADGARWYSEARLSSAFAPRHRGDPHGEGQTHADGVVGHFAFRGTTTAGLTLEHPATQFVVIEAKMGSGLTPHTSKVSWFDQAARNIAAMAWTIHKSDVPVDQLDSLAFYVFAPVDRLDSEPTFSEFMDPGGVRHKIERRIDLYIDDAEALGRLGKFREATALAVLERITIASVSWEDLLDSVDHELQPTLRQFYEECLRHNVVRGLG